MRPGIVGGVRALPGHRREPLLGFRDHPLRLGAVHPAADVGGLARLEFLVDVEEVADLVEHVLGHVGQVPDPGLADVVRADAEDLSVRPALVAHPEDGDRPHGQQAAGERGLIHPGKHVDRRAVLREGAKDLAVVQRVDRRREQHPVQPDVPAHGIDLVLVARPLGGFDNDLNVHGSQAYPAPCRSHKGHLVLRKGTQRLDSLKRGCCY